MLKNSLPTIAVIGCGSMAQSLLKTATPLAEKYQFRFASRTLDSAKKLATPFDSPAFTDNIEAVEGAGHVLLAVKPYIAEAVITELADKLSPKCHLISVMAGITSDVLQAWSGCSAVTRVMPNTPTAIGYGTSGVYYNDQVTPLEKAFVQELLATTGLVAELSDEKQIHSVTAIAGSGPAYFFAFMQAMLQEAKNMQVTEEDAFELINQTALGAAQLAVEARENNLSYQELIGQIGKKGSATAWALEAFEQAGLNSIVSAAMQRCHTKSEQWAEQFSINEPNNNKS